MTLEECRAFIDHHCVLRSPPGKHLLISPNGHLNTWQFYLPIAILDQKFAAAIARLFWEYFRGSYVRRPFQLCGCESGGVPLASALQAMGHETGCPVNVFAAKKQAKNYGLGNWLEGVVDPDLPVLLVDDVLGGGNTLTTQAARLTSFGLQLHPEAFCVASCKTIELPRSIKVGEQYISVKTFFGPDDFSRTFESYVRKYGALPQFHGTLV